jgi:hypothetical protein
MRDVLKTWWPLAASWLLMATELPLVSAVMSRLPDPEISLAAWGGVVFPLSLIVESPVIMLLAASTALSNDSMGYRKLRQFMLSAGALLTILHVALAFTPLYDLVAGKIIGVPQQVLEPARIGLRLMTPWTWSIAFRRFHQGVLIRYGHSEAVGIGTAIRLTVDATVLGIGLVHGGFPGIVVAGTAVAAGVLAEAVYAGLRSRPVIRSRGLAVLEEGKESMPTSSLMQFYIPLALTSLLTLLTQPIGSAALSRMPRALESLAVWPVISGLVFMSRSIGVAYNEVVVALLDRPGSLRSLRGFTAILAGATTALLILVAFTPLSTFWFGEVSGLRPQLAGLGRTALFFALPMPGLVVLHSWYQGMLVNRRSTRGITESVAISLLGTSLVLLLGILDGTVPGLIIAWVAFDVGALLQLGWLWLRTRGPRGELEVEDSWELPHVQIDSSVG